MVETAKKEMKIKQIIGTDYSDDTFDLMLGNMYFSEGLYPEAITHIQNIEKRNPGSPLPHQMLSRIYRQIGLKDLASYLGAWHNDQIIKKLDADRLIYTWDILT